MKVLFYKYVKKNYLLSGFVFPVCYTGIDFIYFINHLSAAGTNLNLWMSTC
jgi:hypothetical protein